MILVIGGTGTVGRDVVRFLAERGAPVRVLLRSPEKASAFLGLDVDFVRGDLAEPHSLRAAMEGAEKLFLLSSLSPRQAELESNAVEAAAGSGIGLIVKVSALGASSRSDILLVRQHAAVEARIRASGIPTVVLRPHHFMQNLLDQATTIVTEHAFYGAAGGGRFPAVDTRDVAEVAAVTLTTPGHEGRLYRLTGPVALSYTEMAAALGRALGQPVRYVDLPPHEWRERLAQSGTPEWRAADLVRIQEVYATGRGGEPTAHVEQVLGKPARAFSDFARDYAPVLLAASRSAGPGAR
ncbi:MAG TPA: SDR family oxidoreductase [Longimicrobiales bacterium]